MGRFLLPIFEYSWYKIMTIKVGRISFLDAEPFYFDMARRGIELHDMVPDQLASAAENGEIDAGPVPLADVFRLEDQFQPISGFCLACNDVARSIALYSKLPIEELAGGRIAVNDDSNAAVRLLQVLLELKYQVHPDSYVSPEDEHDALLLMGNRALRLRRGARGYPHKYDLGEEWNKWTGLPLVYARWVVRKDLDPKDIALIEDTLYVGLEDGVDALYHLADPREDLLMLPRDVVEYVQGLRYFVGMSEQRAIDKFREYSDQLTL